MFGSGHIFLNLSFEAIEDLSWEKETIAFIMAFAASFCVDENDDGVIFECFLN